jgi:hypothetical protein
MKIIEKKIVVLSVILLAACLSVFSQKEMGFSVFVFKSRYDSTGKKYIEDNNIFRKIDYLGGYMIDPGKKGVIDLESVRKYVKKIYPRSDDTGTLCINLENRLYQNLKTSKPESEEYEEAIREFRQMLITIRVLRPKIKMGIYGFPFRVYYPSQNKHNADSKLDPILSLTDYLFPSLYILYPDKQRSSTANNLYFEQTLDAAFEYAARLNKPVVPFVWYLVHPNNKIHGFRLLEKDEMKRYISYISNYKPSGESIKGIVWWETPTPYLNNSIKTDPETEKTELNSTVILREYMEHLGY